MCDSPPKNEAIKLDTETARNGDRPVECTAFTSDPFISEQI